MGTLFEVTYNKGRTRSITGPMFAGKTEELLLLQRKAIIAKQRFLIFNSHLDAERHGNGKIGSHAGQIENSLTYQSSKNIWDSYIKATNSLNLAFYGLEGTINDEHIQKMEPIKTPSEKPVSHVFINEAQFCDSGIIDVVKNLNSKGTNVYLTFLNRTSFGEPFKFTDYSSSEKSVADLLAISHEVQILTAICESCKREATETYKLVSTGETITVGGSNQYQARCIDDWHPVK